MPTQRIYQIARELGTPNEEILAACRTLGVDARNHMSGINEEDALSVCRFVERARRESVVEERIAPTVVRRRSTRPTPPPEPERPVMARRPAAPPPEAPEAVVRGKQEAELLPPGTVPLRIVSMPPAPIPPPPPAEAQSASAFPPVSAEPPAPPAPPAPVPEVEARQRPVPMPAPLGATGPRRFEVISGRDIYSGRGAVKPTRSKRRKAVPVRPSKAPVEAQPMKVAKRVIKVEGAVTLQDLARRMGVKATEVLFKLIGLGMQGVNINSSLDIDTAKIVAGEFQYEVVDVHRDDQDLLAEAHKDVQVSDADIVRRPPVVTVMGHVDHGKTTLLDFIRNTKVAAGEAGGITQHIGADYVDTAHGPIVFLDTPGHEAFTSMRARGAKVTDLVVLVVAADDGVMPQTIEAISHSRAAGVPIVVALNKTDKDGANADRVKRQLAENDLLPEDWGGQTIVCPVSARTGDGVEHLLEMLALQAEVMDLKANPNRPAAGVVLEAYLDRGRGPVANVLVKDGTLRAGDFLVAGEAFGKIRAITAAGGAQDKEAGPSHTVEVLGLSVVPMAGDLVHVVPDAKQAQAIAESRVQKISKGAPGALGRLSLEEFVKQKMQEGGAQDLNLVLKTDVQGSAEAISAALGRLSTEAIHVNILQASVGGITDSDVLLAAASRAIIVGFGVRPTGKARKMADAEKIEIRFYGVIYDLIDDVKKAMAGLLKPTMQEVFLGRAEVRQIFNISKVGVVAGCLVAEGKIVRSAQVRLVRDSLQVWAGRIASLKHFKDDVREVLTGFECGITLDGYNDVKPADVVEAFETREVAATIA